MSSPSEICVREANDADQGRWNAYLDTLPGISPLARYEWRTILSNAYGVPTTFLIAEYAGEITGVLGGYEVGDLARARRFYSLRAGGAADDRATAKAIQEYLEKTGARRGWCDGVLTTGDREWGGMRADTLKKTVQLDIDEDEQKMWSGLRDKTRNMIRRAERNEIFMVSGHEHLQTLYNHYRENMSRLGVTLHSRKYFVEIMQQMGPHAEILVALHGSRPIASMLLLLGCDFACYPVQNAVLEARSLAPIQFLNWEAMKLCRSRGITRLDMGESGENSPVYRSKVNFGGRPQDLHYYALSRRNPLQGQPGILSRNIGRALHAGCNIVRKTGPERLRAHMLERLHRMGRLL